MEDNMLISRRIAIAAPVLIYFIIPIATEAAKWNPLPDTGQTTCYNATGKIIICPTEGEPFYGQDAQYQGPSPSFTDNGDGTVTDNNTGLIWQKINRHYSTGGGISVNWNSATNYCSNLEIGNLSNWRLPELIEMDSILALGVDVGLGFFKPFLNYHDPDGVYWCPYWTATQYAYDSGYAWGILVYKRLDFHTDKTVSALVRCVHD
jgi:hypothetical protein